MNVDLVHVAELLHTHLTGALVASAYEKLRSRERQRSWTLERMMEFWTAVILRAPKSLSEALREASGSRSSAYPAPETTNQAFFQRCASLRWTFFAEVFRAFADSVRASEAPRFAQHLRPTAKRFAGLFVVDGSNLDPVARRLKITQGHSAAPLPGSVVACYDLMRGTIAALCYSHTQRRGELDLAREALTGVERGSLVLGDRLYGTPKILAEVGEQGLFGLFRRPANGHIEVQEALGIHDYAGGQLLDERILLGKRAQVPARRLQLLLGENTYEFVTNVLDVGQLPAMAAADLYRERWQVERLFFDLKEVLNLKRFYCGNANAVAMQLYASAIVHTAMRTAQGRIAAEARIEPEAIREAKLFPLLGATSATLVTLEMGFLMTEAANPGVKLRKPDWHAACALDVPLSRILADRTRGDRPRESTRRFQWAVRWRELPPPPEDPPERR